MPKLISEIPNYILLQLYELKGESIIGESILYEEWIRENWDKSFEDEEVQQELTSTTIINNRIVWDDRYNIFTQMIQRENIQAFYFFWEQLTDEYKKAMLSDLCYVDVTEEGATGSLLTIAILKNNQELQHFILEESSRLEQTYDQLNMLYNYRIYANYAEMVIDENREIKEIEVPLLIWLTLCAAHTEDITSKQKYINAALKLIEYGADPNLAADDVILEWNEYTDPLDIARDSPCIVAIKLEQVEILKALLQTPNLACDIQGNHGFSIKHVMQIVNNPTITSMIDQLGLEEDLIDDQGNEASYITEEVIALGDNVYAASKTCLAIRWNACDSEDTVGY